MKSKAAATVLCLLLAGCGAETANEEPAATTENPEGFAEPLTDAIEDAKAVEDEIMRQKAEIDAAIEEAVDD